MIEVCQGRQIWTALRPSSPFPLLNAEPQTGPWFRTRASAAQGILELPQGGGFDSKMDIGDAFLQPSPQAARLQSAGCWRRKRIASRFWALIMATPFESATSPPRRRPSGLIIDRTGCVALRIPVRDAHIENQAVGGCPTVLDYALYPSSWTGREILASMVIGLPRHTTLLPNHA
jgi:hypothetical protein